LVGSIWGWAMGEDEIKKLRGDAKKLIAKEMDLRYGWSNKPRVLLKHSQGEWMLQKAKLMSTKAYARHKDSCTWTVDDKNTVSIDTKGSNISKEDLLVLRKLAAAEKVISGIETYFTTTTIVKTVDRELVEEVKVDGKTMDKGYDTFQPLHDIKSFLEKNETLLAEPRNPAFFKSKTAKTASESLAAETVERCDGLEGGGTKPAAT